MSESKLREQSLNFSVEILNLVKELKFKHESIISNQIGRAGTSIGANIHEAQYAHSKADFISKLQIALKEASEMKCTPKVRQCGIMSNKGVHFYA